MTEKVEITGLSRVKKPKPKRDGNTILAFFNCNARGFELHGCALVRTMAGGLLAWPPKFDIKDTRRTIAITDDALRHGMMMHAREAYRALGGTDAEEIGSCIPMPPRDI